MPKTYEQKIDELYLAIVGNPEMDQPGIVDSIRRMKEKEEQTDGRIHRIEKFLDRGKWFLVGGVVMGGYGLTKLAEELFKLL